MKKSFLITLSALLFVGISCKKNNTTDPSPSPATTPNILFIIADDMGKDATNGFAEGSIKPVTPNINAIRNAGIQFNNFWVYPTCSPTRASILTGKYGYRTGVKWAGDELALSETSLQKYISTNTNNKYATAVVGKWHLSGNNTSINPESFGIDYYAGLIRGEAQSFYNWQLTEDGNSTLVTDYTTTKFTDLAKSWIAQQSKPWFMWLAYNAPHTPFHVPPSGMHSQGNLPPYTSGLNPTPYYMAAIEAMDYQIGQLLASMSAEKRANTIIVFIGDNGTPEEVAQSPYSTTTSKGSLYQGGVNTPMFVAGAGVTRTGIDNNLITGTDLFATFAEVAGVTVSSINDSKSFKSLFTTSSKTRDYQYAEKDDGSTNAWTISNGKYKLMVFISGLKRMYNLQTDPYENTDLLTSTLTTEATNAKLELEAELTRIR